jgi:hypothetical protein
MPTLRTEQVNVLLANHTRFAIRLAKLDQMIATRCTTDRAFRYSQRHMNVRVQREKLAELMDRSLKLLTKLVNTLEQEDLCP